MKHLPTMNFKERGITIGDLLILFIIILTSTTLIRSLNKDKKTTFNYSDQEKKSYVKHLIPEINLKNLYS